jgi:hypothetical protein
LNNFCIALYALVYHALGDKPQCFFVLYWQLR